MSKSKQREAPLGFGGKPLSGEELAEWEARQDEIEAELKRSRASELWWFHRMSLGRAARINGVKGLLDLVSFKDVADWCSREPNGIDRNEARRFQALRDLEDAIDHGEFGPLNKPRVLFLGASLLELERGKLRHFRAYGLQIKRRREAGYSITEELWAPRDLVLRWMKGRGINAPQWLEKPTRQTSAPGKPARSVSMTELRAFLKRPEILTLTRTEQKAKARKYFGSRHFSRAEFRDACSQAPRLAGKRPSNKT